jgi:hypothetical protein
MKNDARSTNVKDTPGQKKSAAKPAAPKANGHKAGDAHEKRPGTERASLPGERAEGEGMIAPEPDESSKLEGEGSYTATHHYDEGVARTVAGGKTEELGKKAAAALDGPEGDELREAEQAAKHGHSN